MFLSFVSVVGFCAFGKAEESDEDTDKAREEGPGAVGALGADDVTRHPREKQLNQHKHQVPGDAALGLRLPYLLGLRLPYLLGFRRWRGLLTLPLRVCALDSFDQCGVVTPLQLRLGLRRRFLVAGALDVRLDAGEVYTGELTGTGALLSRRFWRGGPGKGRVPTSMPSSLRSCSIR